MPVRPVRPFPCGWPGCFCDVIVVYMLTVEVHMFVVMPVR
jgi:hypothetical protein